MKKIYLLMFLVLAFLSGCGGVDWFPENTTTSGSGSGTSGSPTLTKSYKPSAMLAGTSSILTFTIVNGTGNPAQSGLGFSDLLSSNLSITADAAQCGGTVTTVSNQILFTGGQLTLGAANCSITATVTGTTVGSFTNKSTDIANFKGGLLNGVTDQTLTVFPTSMTSGNVTLSNLVFFAFPSTATTLTYTVSVDATNTGATDANIIYTVVAIDSSGAEILPTLSEIVDTVPANTTTPIQLLPTAIDVSVTDAAKIQFWRIKSLTVQ